MNQKPFKYTDELPVGDSQKHVDTIGPNEAYASYHTA